MWISMTTKVTKMAKKTSKSDVRYSLDYNDVECYGVQFCCGLTEVSGLDRDAVDTFSRSEFEARGYATSQTFEEEFPHASLESLFGEWYESFQRERATTSVFMTLVSRYSNQSARVKKKGQFPEFLEWLIKKKKWKVYSKFINSNTKNEVTILGKNFPTVRGKSSSGIFTSSYYD
jgi:hypothetical protein